ncbi:hypothetical protein [Paraglaciecola aestuariivivens]
MKITRIAAGLVLLPLCTSVWAANQDLSGSFKTIKNVTIVESTPMVINGLYLASGSSCVMTTPTLTDNFPGETVMKLSAATSSPAASADYGETTGATCSGDDGVPGVYEIEGSAGADVTISLTNGSGSGLTFAPVGCAGDYDGNPDGDVCLNVPNSGSATITLAASGDETVSAGNGVPAAGFSYLALGGTVTSSVGLAAATAYSVDFDISVTY